MPARRYIAAAAIAVHVIAAALVATLLAAVGPFGGAQAAGYADGSTPRDAAASCWEIKQGHPNLPTGLYWISTPSMPAPMRLFCDQNTDGGGWVMIARGRHSWTESGGGTFGSGTWPWSLPVNGSGDAMLAKQLPGSTIDALLDGRRVDALTDGIRLRRAANTAGTAWQESRVKLASRDRWSWSFSSKLAVRSYTVNGETSNAAQTWADLKIGNADDGRRTWSFLWSGNKYTRGFNYGYSGPRGNTSTKSFLYSARSDGRYATPFTQMFVRPKLIRSQLESTRIPDSGTRAVTSRPVAQSGALANRWGVVGLGAGGTIDTATEVSAFAQIGSVMYVGGNFTHVRDALTGKKYAQPYLAAFDAGTGAWISSFKPQLNNQVKALTTFNGSLAVGGQFTKVNGSTREGVTLLKPSTGALDTRFNVRLRMTTKGSKLWVRSLLAVGDRLYVGGQFTDVYGTGSKAWAPRNNLTRLRTNGAVDAWAPNLGTGLKRSATARSPFSSVNSLATRNGTLYAAGQFAQAYMRAEDGKPTIAMKAAAAITMGESATFVPWPVQFSTPTELYQYQLALLSTDSWLWLGGSQHSLARYNPSSRVLAGGNVTLNGGDIQSLTQGSGVVYAGCHCNDWNYQDTMSFPAATGFSQADRIGFVGAWDAATGDYLPSFAPSMSTRKGEGAWAVTTATDGTLWVGGDFTGALTASGARTWAGGFVRFPRTPSTAPAAPTQLRASGSGDRATLTWTKSSTSGVTYEVLENDRVVAFPRSATTASGLVVDGTARFFVRAVDAAGNRSASTPVVPVTAGPTQPAPTTPPPPDPVATTLLPSGSSWSISLEQEGSTWLTGGWVGTWTSGKAPIGWGSSANVTDLAGNPVVAYVRREFSIAELGGTVTLTTRADDGAAVYVNGVEVGRRNLPAGALTSTTRATASPSGGSLDWTITVPANLLKVGRNLIAVEVHRGPGASPDASFDLAVTQTR